MGTIKLPSKSIKFFEENYPDIFSSGNLAEGKWNEKVAEWGCKYTRSPYALAFNSNGSGLFTILRLLKRYRSKKTIFLQSNTMYGVKTIALASGLKLKGFVDCSLDYLMPTFEQFEAFASNLEDPGNSVFLLTHIGGWINPEIAEIASYCDNKGITLVEDCAHSLGSKLENNHSGLFGIAGVYSMYATKTVPVGEGGLMVCRDDELYEMSKRFIMYDRFSQEIDVGVNLRMSEINALLTLSVLKETEIIIDNKYLISEKYQKICDEFSIEYIDPLSNNHRSNLYKFIILARNDEQLQRIQKIKSVTSKVYDYFLGKDTFEIARRHFCLPIWYAQDDEVTNRVLNELKEL